MKIAQITECLTDNGVSTVIRNLTSGFREAGHQVDIITWRESAGSDPGSIQVDIKGLSDDSEPLLRRFMRSLLGSRLWEWLNSRAYSRQMQKQIDFDKYDAVLIHGLACIPLWRLPDSFFIVAHSTKSKMLLRSRQLLFRPLLRHIYSRMYQAHPVICVSKGAREDMIKAFGVDPDSVTAIYNPFPIEDIRRMALEPINDVPEEYLLAVGRPVKSKRFDRLMRVYKLSGVEAPLVVMVGTGKAEKIERLAQRYGVAQRVKVIGFRENPYPYMTKARLLVLTSDYEGLPTVLIESLICGTPVVSTDCPSGPREILNGRQAQGLVPLGNEILLAQRIVQLFQDAPAVSSEVCDRFSTEKTISDYLACFKVIADASFDKQI